MAAQDLNREEFTQRIAGEQPVLVDYWAPWCGYCRRIAPAYEKVAEERGAELLVARVNIDEEAALADAEKIEVIPTLVLYQNGQAVASITAPDSKAAIDRFLQDAMEKRG